MHRVAIIAALEREMKPLLSDGHWHPAQAIRVAGRSYERDGVLVVCGGVGSDPARKATEKAIAAYEPGLVISAGIAGALVPGWRVGQIMLPELIVDSAQGTGIEVKAAPQLAGIPCQGTLVSATGIAGPEGKRLLARQYQAEATDMEAAAVATVAQAHGLPFLAIKAISDEYDFPMPDLEPYVDEQGRFRTGRFALHAAVRPAMWPVMSKLASNSSKASQELCRVLEMLLEQLDEGSVSDAAHV